MEFHHFVGPQLTSCALLGTRSMPLLRAVRHKVQCEGRHRQQKPLLISAMNDAKMGETCEIHGDIKGIVQQYRGNKPQQTTYIVVMDHS